MTPLELKAIWAARDERYASHRYILDQPAILAVRNWRMTEALQERTGGEMWAQARSWVQPPFATPGVRARR